MRSKLIKYIIMIWVKFQIVAKATEEIVYVGWESGWFWLMGESRKLLELLKELRRSYWRI